MILQPGAAFFRLPLELRQHIYSLLLPEKNVSHPLPSVGITSVSHEPPSRPLLNIHPTITEELLDHFYAISTWKLVFSHAFNFFRIDPELRHLESCSSLKRIRKIEVVFFCDVLLLQSYPSFGLEKFCAEIQKRASRACDVLNQAPLLREVVVSWCDSTSTGNWPEKSKILTPLSKLNEGTTDRGPVSFRVGKVTGPNDLDRADFVEALRDIVGTDHKLESGSDEAGDPSSSLRMLAFDVRQERHKINGQPGALPLPRAARSGWRGAPPSLEPPVEADTE